jgi:NADH:ubiquinone reductase (H+-translocating)
VHRRASSGAQVRIVARVTPRHVWVGSTHLVLVGTTEGATMGTRSNHATHRVVVLGAGYAGMAAAVQLGARLKRRTDVRVTLVNPHERFTERMRLHMTATGQQLKDLYIPDLLAGTAALLEQGWVTAIDPDAQTVRIDDERDLPYDTLVYALGGVADPAAVAGVDDHAYTLNSVHDAGLLTDRLATLHSGPVMVCGSGLTGIEAAAEIAERYPALDVVLLGRTEPGATMHPKPAAYLRAALERLGVRVRSGVEVVKVLPDAVELAGGENVAAGAVLWTSGTRVSPLAAAAGLTVDERGRIVTDATLRSVSHPSVYAVGDAAAVRQGYGVMHGTCQGGMPTGVHAAVSIVRELGGRPPKPFRFGYYHTPVSLGRHDGVVQFTHPDDSPRRMYLTGRLAARYKETVTASPWSTYGRMKRMPASGAYWPRGGRFTRGTQ